MTLPDFLIAGAMKCGSTTLYNALLSHPDVFMPENKEPQFFSRDEVYARGLDWYSQMFAMAQPGQICGEASTCYSRFVEYPQAIHRIRSTLPEARILYIIRDPVPRAISHYRHRMEERWIFESEALVNFTAATELYPDILDAGQYAAQIEKFEEAFGRDQFLPIVFEQMVEDPPGILQAIAAFLGLNTEHFVGHELSRENQSGAIVAKNEARSTVSKLANLPLIGKVKQLIGPQVRAQLRDTATGLIRARNARRGLDQSVQIPALTASERTDLENLYQTPNQHLMAHLGQALPGWTCVAETTDSAHV